MRERPMSPLSAAHLDALDIVIPALESAGVWYRATGGLAGNLHGSTWPLHDIDLDYRRAEWPRIERALQRYLVTPPHDYADHEFRITMATARVGPIDIELCQLEDGYVGGRDGWQLLDPDPQRRERRVFEGRPIWTLPLADLIHYKELIRRRADVAELRTLDERGSNHTGPAPAGK